MDHQMDFPSIQTLLLLILNVNCGIISRYGNLHLILSVLFSSILQKVRSDFNTEFRPAQIGISLIRSTASNPISNTKGQRECVVWVWFTPPHSHSKLHSNLVRQRRYSRSPSFPINQVRF